MTTIVVTTAASVTKLIKDSPNILAEAVSNAVLTNRDIPGAILSNTLYGFNHAVGTKFFNYGRDSFVNGLPVSQYVREVPEAVDLDALVTQAINYELVVADPAADLVSLIRSARLTYSDPLHLFTFFLQENEDWILTSLVDTTYNEFIQVSTGNVYQYAGIVLDFKQGNLNAKIQPADSNPTLPMLELNIPYNFNEFSYIIQVFYEVLQGNGETHWHIWIYSPASGLYPYLTFGFGTLDSVGFFPIVPIRLNNENIIDNPDHAELAQSSKDLLRRINFDLDDFSAGLTDPDDPTALDDTDNAYLMFALNLNSDETIAKQYMYEYFKSLFYSQEWTQQEWFDHNEQIGPDLSISIGSRNSLHIKDKWFDVGIDIRIWFNFITLEVKSGLIGDPQPAYDPYVIKAYPGDVDMNNADGDEISKSIIVGSEWSGTSVGEEYSYNTHLLILRKQISPTEFVELAIHGLQHDMIIDERAKKINTNITTMDDGRFFIPISKDIVDKFNGRNESYIYYETFTFLAYAIDVNKLKWYEDPDFWKFVGLVAFVFGFDVSLLTAAIAEGVVSTMAYVAEQYLISLIMQKALGAVVDLVGGDVALILAAVAATIAISYGEDVDIAGLINSDELLKMSTLTIDAVNTHVVDEMLKLEVEMDEYLKSAKEKQEEIDNAYDLLDVGTELDIYAITHATSYTDYNETPENFYNRTIHQTNPGVLSLDSIEHYVSGALRLPEAPTN